MHSNIKKIFTTISSISDFSKRIIIHGLQLAIGLIFMALVFYHIFSTTSTFNLKILSITFETAKIGLTIFAEAIIGGLIVDYLIKKI